MMFCPFNCSLTLIYGEINAMFLQVAKINLCK